MIRKEQEQRMHQALNKPPFSKGDKVQKTWGDHAMGTVVQCYGVAQYTHRAHVRMDATGEVISFSTIDLIR
tara:strand:+ start:795 stop:1007 length:213 start_codon:yes stop_codon:yes gene_type:complete